MTRTLRLPGNVRVLNDARPETVRLDDLGVAIHGQSFARAAVTENLAAGYPDAVPGWVNIGLLHTGLTGLEGHERYAPCTIEDLRARGYDYWALGHIHTRRAHCDDPPVVFPGNPQGRHIRESGEKGCLLTTDRTGRRRRAGVPPARRGPLGAEPGGRHGARDRGRLARPRRRGARRAAPVRIRPRAAAGRPRGRSRHLAAARPAARRARAVRRRGPQPGPGAGRGPALDREGRVPDPPGAVDRRARRPDRGAA